MDDAVEREIIARFEVNEAYRLAGVHDPSTRALTILNELNGDVTLARASLAEGVFDALCGPRQAAIVDLVGFFGVSGWGRWPTSEGLALARMLIVDGQDYRRHGLLVESHIAFIEAADQLLQARGDSARVKRDAAMIRSGAYCKPTGDGSDV